jgi:signal transduction histidine kinase
MPSRPEAIDSRLVFRIYSAAALPLGIITFSWPLIVPGTFPTLESNVRLRLAAAVVTALGTCGAALARIDDPIGRRRGLIGFAHAHVMLGAMLLTQALTAWSSPLGTLLAWSALIVGFVLLYLAITGPGSDLTPALPPLVSDPQGRSRGVVVRNKPGLARLRSEYEEQIRQAARQEERARLARDLHDAVKQQLFAIQTAGATALARFANDRPGALDAIAQVRSAAREAMAEMEAMLDQLQGAPIENAGLVAFLRRQCEALGFQTGARVTFTPGTLPSATAIDPAGRQTIARVAQEVLSNVARHARAANVDVTLDTVDGRLVLMVKDDGCGFETDGAERRRGMGLTNVATRAAEVGGAVDIVSAASSGTTVRFSMPCAVVSPPRAYVVRAVAWSLVAIAGLVMLSRQSAVRPMWLTVALIGAIAVARYTVAAVALARAGRPA